jgi:hypothetical protein
MQPDSTFLDNIPGMSVLESVLQRNIQVNLNKKTVKTGRLILFKRIHYYIHLTFLNCKNNIENYEIPIPFAIEYYPENGLIYFDYRIGTLAKKHTDIAKKLKSYREHAVQNTSNFYDRILEIVTVE